MRFMEWLAGLYLPRLLLSAGAAPPYDRSCSPNGQEHSLHILFPTPQSLKVALEPTAKTVNSHMTVH